MSEKNIKGGKYFCCLLMKQIVVLLCWFLRSDEERNCNEKWQKKMKKKRINVPVRLLVKISLSLIISVKFLWVTIIFKFGYWLRVQIIVKDRHANYGPTLIIGLWCTTF